MRSPELAETYQRLIEEGEAAAGGREAQIAAARTAWSSGFVAHEIDKFCATTSWIDTSGHHHYGLLSGSDMAGWMPSVEAPVTFDYGDYTVCKTDSWGQGPVFLQQLALLAGFELGSLEPHSADYIHLVVEASKLAFADREAWYGDSGTVENLSETLLSPEYNDERRRLISDTASLELRPGTVSGHAPVLPSEVARGGRSQGLGGGDPTLGMGLVRGDTCHIDVVDDAGNVVSATPSGGWLQSSPTIPALGFCLGTRAQMFWLERDLPNSLRAGARPRTTLSPSLALRNGAPWLAFGTPGGDQQDQWSLALFLSLAHRNLGLQEAIDSPAFHSEHAPSSFYPRAASPGRLVVESRFDQATIKELTRRGHDVVVEGAWTLGRLSAVARGEDFLEAGSNARGAQGYAVGR